ncbi:helix-turn-helix transcriptional regulator [Rhodococcus kroppenstedtii]|uniref:helix-turn-helix domain-containing protein n=1 Tax=Rhodococcoides kroppenstedtii TaxID=293050 RepID=UPI0029529BF2|nr:helix-turn-helix transcriptional regulator [Rhodococcus kroppenstedtii]MDV7197027.1 helix-turn-helix transcriptional regulator [Rhodococcus kroppenstedtii]
MREGNESSEQGVGQRFAQAVKEARINKGWSQRKLVEELERVTGFKLDPSAMTRMENGQRDVKLDEAEALSRVLEMPLTPVITGAQERLANECMLWLVAYEALRDSGVELAERVTKAKDEDRVTESRQVRVATADSLPEPLPEGADGVSGFAEFIDTIPLLPEVSYVIEGQARDLSVGGVKPVEKS